VNYKFGGVVEPLFPDDLETLETSSRSA
jgi:hypothetical protein